MNINVIQISRLIYILIALVFAAGCGQQSDSARKPKVIRKKIVAAAKAPSPTSKKTKAKAAGKAAAPRPRSDIARAKPPRSKAASQPAAPGKGTTVTQKGLRPKSDIARKPVPAKPAETAARKSGTQKKKAPKETAAALPAAKSTKTALQPQASLSESKPEAIPAAGKKQSKKPDAKKKGPPATYNPEGKTDPFKPLFQEKAELPKKRTRKRRAPRTPLERLALSQLKLTAILMAPSGNRALVQEASGKGYVIKAGTYIGLDGGKVIEIQKDRVVIEEEVEDFIGKLSKRKKELKLPKPAGDR